MHVADVASYKLSIVNLNNDNGSCIRILNIINILIVHRHTTK